MDFGVCLFWTPEDRPELLELGILGIEWVPYFWTNPGEEGFLLQNLNMSCCFQARSFPPFFSLCCWNNDVITFLGNGWHSLLTISSRISSIVGASLWQALLPRLVHSLWRLPCGFVDHGLKLLAASRGLLDTAGYMVCKWGSGYKPQVLGNL